MNRSLIIFAACGVASLAALPRPAFASTYYVDATTGVGSDTNAGTSSAAPWRTLTKVNNTTFAPGDTLLFRAGSQWNGQLFPKGSGSASGGSIKINLYGSGARPKIIGGGVGRRCWSGSTPTGAVYLENQSYWEIRNLDVSNIGSAGCEYVGIKVANNSVPAFVARHIYIGDNVIHDVYGLATGYYATNAGISVTAAMDTGNPCPTWPNACPANNVWTDVTIENNTIYAVDRIGIFVGPDWETSGSVHLNFPLFPRRMGSAFGSLPYGVTIRGNQLSNIGSDGILSYIAANVTMERNVVSNSGNRVALAQCGTGCPANWTGASNCNSVAIWTALTDQSTLQYNEVYNYSTQSTTGYTQCDGGAFDSDWGTTNQTVQYNYSHQNQGGMHLTCETEETPTSPIAMNNIRVRYNVSYGDYGGAFTFACGKGTFPLGGDSMDINNNVVIVPAGISMPIFGGSTTVAGVGYIYNNLFLVYGSTSYAQLPDAVFDYNTYYAPNYPFPTRPSQEPCAPAAVNCPSASYAKRDAHRLTSDPQLLSTPTSVAPTGFVNLSGLRLRTGSPNLDTGYQPGYGGDGQPGLGWVDFWGNSTALDPNPNRGAYNGPGL